MTGHLNSLETRWSMICRAHDAGFAASAEEARKLMVLRYSPVIRQYLGGILKNQDDADELSQEILVRLLKGDFAGADPARGRFRDFLKAAIRNLARNHWAKEARRRPVEFDLAFVADDRGTLDEEWIQSWRKFVMDQAWAVLKAEEKAGRATSAHSALRLWADFPEATSEELATKLSEQRGESVSPEAFRKMVSRAKARFREAIVAEVRSGLDDESPDRLAEDLALLGFSE